MRVFPSTSHPPPPFISATEKTSGGPRKWREFAQTEAASEAHLFPQQNLPGWWEQERRQEPPPPPPQDEVLHSLGVQKGSLCCGKALKAASTQLPTSLPASGLVPGPVGGRLAAAAVRALRCLSPPWWAGRRLWEVERTRLLFRA